MSNLICYCSIAAIATVACTCYIAYLPPTLFGCLAGVFFFVRGALPEKELQGVNVSCHMIFHLVLKGPKLCNTYYIYINYIYMYYLYIILYIYTHMHNLLLPFCVLLHACEFGGMVLKVNHPKLVPGHA